MNESEESKQATSGVFRCRECGESFGSEEDYETHQQVHREADRAGVGGRPGKNSPIQPNPVPATERYGLGNPGVTAGVAQHEAGGQFSGQPNPKRPGSHTHGNQASTAKPKHLAAAATQSDKKAR